METEIVHGDGDGLSVMHRTSIDGLHFSWNHRSTTMAVLVDATDDVMFVEIGPWKVNSTTQRHFLLNADAFACLWNGTPIVAL